MVLRHGCLLGLAVALAAAPALGQAPPSKPPDPKRAAARPARSVTIAQTITAPAPSTPGTPHTLAELLAATYASQPALQAERAKLRATDENVPQALAGWRPTVVMAGTAGYADGASRANVGIPSSVTVRTNRLIGTAQATLSQPLYTGGKTQANVNRSKNQVMAERATLLSQEQTSFTNTPSTRLRRCHPGATVTGAGDQQRAGAGQAAPGDQRPVPGRWRSPAPTWRRPRRRWPAPPRAGRPRKAICRRRAARFSK